MQDLIKKIKIGNKDLYWTELQLNRTKALNALSQEMCETLFSELRSIEEDPKCLGLFLTSASDKAFCAGGDVKQVALDLKEGKDDAARNYFLSEYKMDLQVHKLTKPSIVWMNGYVFGGGLGLAFGNDIRIIEPKASISMPEGKIGFFPDVGASLFLGRMPWPIGLFASWSSYRFSPADAIQYGLADYMISPSNKEALREFLQSEEHLAQAQKVDSIKSWCIENQIKEKSHLYEDFSPLLMALDKSSTPQEAYDFFLKKGNSDNDDFKEFFTPWLNEITKSSPSSRAMSYAQMKWTQDLKSKKQGLKIEEALNAELWLAEFAAKQEDFLEGVDKMLISKSHQPQWQNKKMSDYGVESLISGLETNKLKQSIKI